MNTDENGGIFKYWDQEYAVRKCKIESDNVSLSEPRDSLGLHRKWFSQVYAK